MEDSKKAYQKEMRRNIYLFTTNFPYGNSETFLETELPYLAENNDVTIVPLFISGTKREIHPGIKVTSPLLSFSPKDKLKLIIAGIFNFSPLLFAFPEFINHQVIFNRNKTWNFFTSFLLLRSIYPKAKTKFAETDILYFYWADKSALLAPFIKDRHRCKLVVRFHGTDIYEEAAGGYIPFRKLLFKSIDLACPISEDGKKYLQTRYKELAPKKITITRLGVLHYGDNIADKSPVFQLLSCSNIIPIKRVEMIAEVLRHVNFEVNWTHIGEGPGFKNLQNIIQGLPSNIKVKLTGKLSNREIMKLYANHPFDLFINVSESEGIPVSIMEALSFGIPVMATNVGGVSEIVDQHVGVLLDKEITLPELADKIKLFYDLPDKQKFREAAYKKWNDLYNADKNYKLFVEILSGL